jgi:hypothetical protein
MKWSHFNKDLYSHTLDARTTSKQKKMSVSV